MEKTLESPLDCKEIQVRSLGWENPLEKEMATHSSILAWRIPWTEELGELYSPWGLKESDMTEQLIHTPHVIFTPEFRLKEALLHGKFQL